MPVRPGMPFAKDDLLVRFDCAPYKAAINAAKAALRGARADANAKERLAALQSIGQAEVEMARATASQAKAELESAEITASYCSINAPYPGHVVDFLANPFESVQQTQPLLSIIGDSSLEVEVIVPSQWLSWLQQGSRLTVTIDETSTSFQTQVTRIGAQVDAASQSVVVTALVPKGEMNAQSSGQPSIRLRAGMSGTVQFEKQP